MEGDLGHMSTHSKRFFAWAWRRSHSVIIHLNGTFHTVARQLPAQNTTSNLPFLYKFTNYIGLWILTVRLVTKTSNRSQVLPPACTRIQTIHKLLAEADQEPPHPVRLFLFIYLPWKLRQCTSLISQNISEWTRSTPHLPTAMSLRSNSTKGRVVTLRRSGTTSEIWGR